MTESIVSQNDLNTLSVSEFTKAEPNLSPKAYELLKEDIIENGMLNPVIVYNNEIYDGRHRFKIAVEIGCDLKIIETTTISEAKNLSISGNRHRRHLSKAQYAMIAVRDYYKNDKTIILEKSPYILNKYVSMAYVKNAKKVYDKNESLAEEVFNGTKTLEEAVSDINKVIVKEKEAEATKKGTPPKESIQVKRAKEFIANNKLDKKVEKELEDINKREKLSKIDLIKEHLFIKHKLLDLIKEADVKIDLTKKLKDINDELAKALDIEAKKIKEAKEAKGETTNSTTQANSDKNT